MRSFSELRLRKAVHRKSISVPFDDRLHVLTSKGQVVKWERCRIHRDRTVFHNFSQVKPVLGKRKDLVLRTRRHAERHVTLYFFLAIVHFINLGTTILVTAMNRMIERQAKASGCIELQGVVDGFAYERARASTFNLN